MNLDDLLWKKIQRAAADQTMRKNIRQKVEQKYRREFRGASYASRVDADAAKLPVPEDTRSLTARVAGDPLPGRSALDKERERHG